MTASSSDSAKKPRIVVCPACGGSSVYGPGNPFRPFCSERCKGIDLGAWASEQFRMPVDAPPDEPFGDPKLQ
ncbi:MAG: DNA gyrase inhibitor YacG [Burkholderiales bacterium]|nr:DNA gyrase inhibitor YacG [Burkholderiales bacterium]